MAAGRACREPCPLHAGVLSHACVRLGIERRQPAHADRVVRAPRRKRRRHRERAQPQLRALRTAGCGGPARRRPGHTAIHRRHGGRTADEHALPRGEQRSAEQLDLGRAEADADERRVRLGVRPRPRWRVYRSWHRELPLTHGAVMGERDLRRWRELLERREASRGMLVAFEGPDGSGKTTQRKLFKQWLKSEGVPVTTTKWNSSTLIKPLVKVRKHVRALSPEEFCFLHAADFRHRLETEVLPALWEGTTVVAERYLFTALARDAARGLPFDWLLNVYAPILWPDVVFYFAVSSETSGMRIAATREPKYYEAGQDITGIDDPHASYKQFISRVIREYESLALVFRFVTVDAERSINAQHRAIREHYQQVQRLSWPEGSAAPLADWLAHHTEARLGLAGLRRGKPTPGVVAMCRRRGAS